jgi:hypothetical protein
VESTTQPTFSIAIDRVIQRGYHGIGFAQFGASTAAFFWCIGNLHSKRSGHRNVRNYC